MKKKLNIRSYERRCVMKIIFELLTLLWSTTLCLSITLYIWSKFFKTDENKMKVENRMIESEDMLQESNAQDETSIIFNQ
jgi:hypothetical protein